MGSVCLPCFRKPEPNDCLIIQTTQPAYEFTNGAKLIPAFKNGRSLECDTIVQVECTQIFICTGNISDCQESFIVNPIAQDFKRQSSYTKKLLLQAGPYTSKEVESHYGEAGKSPKGQPKNQKEIHEEQKMEESPKKDGSPETKNGSLTFYKEKMGLGKMKQKMFEQGYFFKTSAGGLSAISIIHFVAPETVFGTEKEAKQLEKIIYKL